MKLLFFLWKNLKLPIIFYVISVALSSLFVPFFYNFYVLPYNVSLQEKLVNLQQMFANPNQNLVMKSFSVLVDHDILFILIMLFVYFLTLQVSHFIGGVFKAFALPIFNRRLKEMAFNNVLSMDLQFFRNNNTGDTERKITNLADSFCKTLEITFAIFPFVVQLIISTYWYFKIKLIFVLNQKFSQYF